ncbi:MAG: hypothetical protein NTY02_20315, partial [Acidobacteria bacterium]|nr:hypothetical protein [Acidobacteriota bacterium]
MKSDTQSNRITGSIVLPVASPLGAYLGRLGAIIPSDGSQPCAALAVAPQDARFVIVDADEVNNLATLEPLDPGHQSRVELSGECAAGDRLSCDQQGRVVATDENLAILMAEEPGVDGQLVLVRPIISRTIGPVGPQGEAGLDGNPGDPGPQGDPGLGEGSTLPGDVDWEALDIEVVGPPGPQGEVGPQGPGGHNPCIQGAYDPQQSYVATDMVTCNGILYMALTDSTGADPETNPANWQPLAGATGPQGAPASYAFAGTWSDLTEYNVND